MYNDIEIMKGKLLVLFYFIGFPMIVLLLYYLCLKLDIVSVLIFAYLIIYEINLITKCYLAVKNVKRQDKIYEDLDDYNETEENY